MRPPKTLVSARVTHYAIRDRTVGYIPRGAMWSGNRRIGPVPRFAIAHDGDQYLLLYCGRAWNVRFTTAYSSVTEAKRGAEHRYPGLSTRWKRTGVSKAQAKAWAKRMWKAFACSFCGLPPYEIQFMFERNKVRLCDRCVDVAVAELQRLRTAKAVSDNKRAEQMRQQIATLQQRRGSGAAV